MRTSSQSVRAFMGCGRWLLVAMFAVSQGCTAVAPLADLVEPALLEYSDRQRLLRQQRAAAPLEERIEAIEADLADSLVPVGDGHLAPRHLTNDGRKGPLHLETNAAILSALAAKYAATGDEHAKELGERIIRGIKGLDALSGELDGFVPRYADANTLQPTDATTHANAYTQLLFAYVMADACFGPNDDIRRHVSLIYGKFAEDAFALRHVDGSYVDKADVTGPLMPFNARRTFDRRLLDAAALHLGDERAGELARRHRWMAPRLGPLHFRAFALEAPTTSSTWLNLQALTALNMLGQRYQAQAVALAARYERADNPFFRILAALNGADEDLAAIRRRLAQFPYPATAGGIINSHREDVAIAPRRYVKFTAHPESREPLPLYEVSSSTYLWKRSLLRIDSLPEQDPVVVLGHDLYQAYWFLRLLEARR